jgi:hypothetical protein
MTDASLHLHQLVKTTSTSFAPAVDFGMMADAERNRQLCQGFIFNYEAHQPTTSTVGVLDALRRGFHSASEPSIHLMVQDYGKGKSHFALTVANFFQQPPDSEEVAGILTRVANAVGSESTMLVQQLRSYKQRGRHLVFCLSAVDVFDLRQTFLEVVRKTLENEGITGTKAQRLVDRPLDFLQQIINNSHEKSQAEAWLHPQGYDLAGLVNKLEANDISVVPIVRQLCEEIRHVTPDFSPYVDIKDVLDELIRTYCRGANAPYQGILIVFDELHKYLQQWASDPIGSGNAALQSLTEICENNKTSISLLCLSIRRPLTFTPSKNQEDYKLLASRLELTNSTYEPAASLELVLKNLIQQKEETSDWQAFYAKHQNTLQAESRDVYQERTHSYYASHNWDEGDFYSKVGLGCFPLHPLTTYLLCNLNFTQGRRILQFVDADRHGIAKFIQEQPAEVNGKLNFLRPVALVDAFEENFANPEANTEYIGLYSNYRTAVTKLKAIQNVDPEEFLILKALFLFYASVDKLTPGPHSEVLAMMTGLTSPRVHQILGKLHTERRVIYPDNTGKVYDFFRDGADPDSLRQKIREATAATDADISLVVDYCQRQITDNHYVTARTTPKSFINENRLREENWYFENRVVSVSTLKSKLHSTTWLQDISDDNARGRVVYTLAETGEQITLLKQEIESWLEQSPLKDRLVIAVANQPTSNLARQIIELNYLIKNLSQEDNVAIGQIRQDYGKHIDERVKVLFDSCTYYCDPNVARKISSHDRVRCESVVGALLADQYPFAPPVARNDKMVGGRTSGYLREIMKFLLLDDLRLPLSRINLKSSHGTVIDQVLMADWKILTKKDGKYQVVEPSDPNIREAWNKISELTDLNGKDEKSVRLNEIWSTLHRSPFGYHEHAFTGLLSAWLAAHSKEVVLRGQRSIKLGSHIDIKPVKVWAETEIFTQANGLMNWIRKGDAKLIRRKPANRPEIPPAVTYEEADALIAKLTEYLEFATDTLHQDDVEKTKADLERSIKRTDKHYQACDKAATYLQRSPQNPDLFELIQHYQQLNLSPFSANEGAITVHTPNQHQNCQKIRHQVAKAIEQAIQRLLSRQQSLKTENQCNAYLNELATAHEQMQTFPEFCRFIEDIEQTKIKTVEDLDGIKESEKCKDVLKTLQILHSGLSHNATQAEYASFLDKVHDESQKMPRITNEDEYQRIIADVQRRQANLDSKLQGWQDQISDQASKEDLTKIRDEVVSNQNRYTSTEAKGYINTLLVKLESGIKACDQKAQVVQYQNREQEITELFKQLPIERQSHLINLLTQLRDEKERNNRGF